MILIITGNGKGKTTSAIGQSIRVLGQGGSVFMIQFIKSRKFPAGEDKILPAALGARFVFIKGGLGFIGILGDNLPRAAHAKAAADSLAQGLAAIQSQKYQLVVLDEINIALDLNLIPLDTILSALKNIPAGVDVMLTGRHAPPEIIQVADFVTDCREIKHPFNSGFPGQPSREF